MKDKKYQWTWETGEWDSLSESLRAIEDNGWEVFSIVEVGELGRFVKIISRKPLSEAPERGEVNDSAREY